MDSFRHGWHKTKVDMCRVLKPSPWAVVTVLSSEFV